MICPACSYSFDSSDPIINSMSVNSIIDLSTLPALQKSDPFCQKLDSWRADSSIIPARKVGYFKSFANDLAGIWRFKTALVIPVGSLRLQFLQHFHGRLDHGHFGFKKTMDSMKNHIYWDTMLDDLNLFVSSCDVCQRSKILLEKSQGLLIPLQIPETRFESLNIDFASMPTSIDGFDAFVIISDRLSKLIQVVPCYETTTAKEFAHLFYRNWFLCGFGMPSSIVSDRDSRFLSKFWTAFCSISGIRRDLSTSRHQQTDGGAEVLVGILKTAFKGISNHKQSDWTVKLQEVKFSYNNSTHYATGFTPFYLAYAFDPQAFPCFHDAAVQRNLVKAHLRILTIGTIFCWRICIIEPEWVELGS
jgi:hypothetical protein